MNKKLPNIFKGSSPRSNNQETSIIDNKNNEQDIIENEKQKSIDDQIKDIFDSENFVYKAEVVITLNTGEVLKKTIIGRNHNSLITLDDDLIDVNNISKIEFV